MNSPLVISTLSLGIAIGCVTASVAPRLVVPPARAGTTPTRWEYSCAVVHGPGPEEHTELLNRYGREGWEVASVSAPQSVHTYCFRRALP